MLPTKVLVSLQLFGYYSVSIHALSNSKILFKRTEKIIQEAPGIIQEHKPSVRNLARIPVESVENRGPGATYGLINQLANDKSSHQPIKSTKDVYVQRLDILIGTIDKFKSEINFGNISFPRIDPKLKEDHYTTKFKEITESLNDIDPQYFSVSEETDQMDKYHDNFLSKLNVLQKKMLSDIFKWTQRSSISAKKNLKNDRNLYPGKFENLMENDLGSEQRVSFWYIIFELNKENHQKDNGLINIASKRLFASLEQDQVKEDVLEGLQFIDLIQKTSNFRFSPTYQLGKNLTIKNYAHLEALNKKILHQFSRDNKLNIWKILKKINPFK